MMGYSEPLSEGIDPKSRPLKSSPNIGLDQWVQTHLQNSTYQPGYPYVIRSVTTRVQGSEREHLEIPNTPENLANSQPHHIIRRQTSRETTTRSLFQPAPSNALYTSTNSQYTRTPVPQKYKSSDYRQHQQHLRTVSQHRSVVYGRDAVSPYACLSCLRATFIKRIRFYRKTRQLNCDDIIENAFTGDEAVSALVKVFADRVSKQDCTALVNLLWHSPAPVFLPTRLSPRSVKANSVIESKDEIFTLIDSDDISSDPKKASKIKGVITALTACYVPTCTPKQPGICYAPTCPNREGDKRALVSAFKPLMQVVSILQPLVLNVDPTKEDPDDYKNHKSWVKLAPEELVKSLPAEEITRQELMFELIYTERNHLNLLKAIDQIIIPELDGTTLLSAEEKKDFMRIMFPNYKWFLDRTSAMYDEMHRRQEEYEGECLPRIDDILLKYYLEFEEPVRAYSKSIPFMTHAIKQYSQRNEEFGLLIEDLGSRHALNRLGFRNILLQPVRRSVNIILILESLVKKTAKYNSTYEDLLQCVAVVKNLARINDEEVAASEDIINLQALEIGLGSKTKTHFLTPLRLLDPERKLLRHGNVKIKNSSDSVDTKMFVLDNFLLLVKVKHYALEEEYRLLRRPIPILLANCRELPPVSLSSSLRGSAGNGTSSGVSSQAADYVLAIGSSGQREADTCLAFKTSEEVCSWMAVIDKAKEEVRKRWEDVKFCDLVCIDDKSFQVGDILPKRGEGTIRCTAPFENIRRQKCIAIGTESSIYLMNCVDGTLRRTLFIKNVTQIAVMHKHGVLLVLADKVLLGYPLAAFGDTGSPKPLERLVKEIDKHVNFMKVGQYNGQDYLIYKKRKGNNSMFFPLRPKPNIKEIMLAPSERRLINSSNSWFDSDKVFCVGAECFNVQFFNTRLFIACEQGFEMINLTNLTVTENLINDISSPALSTFNKHLLDSKPLAIFLASEDRALVCYNKVVFYITKSRNVVFQDDTSPVLFDWETPVDHVVYRYPFIAGFSENMIEIHHADTGELLDVLFGDSIRVTHDYELNEVHGCKLDFKANVQLIFSFILRPS
ncbi:CNH domain-containing protein [Phycomyces blakesleeanus]|uniref:DH domain-containing protein n=2 Tax=Phycomyces blakesleeanus TaxID=4837 RepID=A0A162WT37_PHYB8|nr:hypothetical protein PHYBLDRAFT_77613 [Phycomyces blakesleeanus NRRL 1555(-)]OAD70785.1 hypothetical protein PHYBLDRAFT_77613 [Phycomyces blakesleeanus NRRL 1555(-)]|eukprot:XP_018288825.1 hypothetical protein PHYBLDRAFT_77613 [Phycomyces blakesleeanus NRRL 1555(-)]